MAIEVQMTYSDIYDIVAALGAQQCNFDALQEKTRSKFECGYFENNSQNAILANRIIEGWTRHSIDEGWAKRDAEALQKAFELGYRMQAERIAG